MKSIDEIISKIHSKKSAFTVTGISMQYVAVCERECWFYLHGIKGNQSNVHLTVGDKIDKNSFNESESRIIDGMISPDIMDDGTVLEVKKSSDSIEGAKSQLLYYLWYFERFRDEQRDGVISIPRERKRISVDFGDEERSKVEDRIRRIWELWNKDSPPEFEEKPICKSCAYQDFCWG